MEWPFHESIDFAYGVGQRGKEKVISQLNVKYDKY